MKLFVLFFLNIFVNIESTKRRAVNVALETVIEFNNNDRVSDLKFIDDVQNFLGRIKTVLGGKKGGKKTHHKPNHRRALDDLEMKFIDFLEQALEILKSYDDDDMRELCNAFEIELRNFNYEGCKIPELLERSDLRRFLADVLQELKHISAQKVRAALESMLKNLQEQKADKKNKDIIDFINSLHEMEGPQLAEILKDLEGFQSQSKRANMDLQKIVRHALRTTLFDHYSKLNPNLRREFKLKLESFRFSPLTNAVHHRIYNIVDQTTLPPELTSKADPDLEFKKPKSQEESAFDKEEQEPNETTIASTNILRLKSEQTKSSYKFKPYVSLVTEKFTGTTKSPEISIEVSEEHLKTTPSTTLLTEPKTTKEDNTPPSFYTKIDEDVGTAGFMEYQDHDTLTSQPSLQTIYEEPWTTPKKQSIRNDIVKQKSEKHRNKKHHAKKDKIENQRYDDETNDESKRLKRNKHKMRKKHKKHNLREGHKKNRLKQKESSTLPSLVTLYEESYTWQLPKNSKHHKKHHQKKKHKKKNEKRLRAEYDDGNEHETLKPYTRTTLRDVTTARFKDIHTKEKTAETSFEIATNSKETNEVSEDKEDVIARNKKLEALVRHYEKMTARARTDADSYIEDKISEEIPRNKPKIRGEITTNRNLMMTLFPSNEGLSIESFEQNQNISHSMKNINLSYNKLKKKHSKTGEAKNVREINKEMDDLISSGKGNLRFRVDDLMDDVTNNNLTAKPKSLNYSRGTTGNHMQSTETSTLASTTTQKGNAELETSKEKVTETTTTKNDTTTESTTTSEAVNKDFDYRYTDDPKDLLPLRTVNKTLLSDIINYKNKMSVPFRSEPGSQVDIPFIEMLANDTIFASKLSTTTNKSVEDLAKNTMNDLKNIREILFTAKNDTTSTTELNLSEILKDSKDETEDMRRRNMIHLTPLNEDLDSYKEFVDKIGDDLI